MSDSEKNQELEKDKKKRAEKRKQINKEVDLRRKRRPYQIPTWLRLLNVLFGISQIILAGYVLAYPTGAEEFLYLLLGIILILIGLARIVNAFFEEKANGFVRIYNLVLGIILLISGVLMFIPPFGEEIALYILIVVLLLTGIARLLAGPLKSFLPFWYRLLTSIIGIASIVISLVVIIEGTTDSTDVDNYLLIFVAILLNGIARLAKGLAGLNATLPDKE